MKLSLKNLFGNEGESLAFDYEADFSKTDIGGLYPLPHNVRISGECLSGAGAVRLEAKAEFVYSAPCDRCFEDVSRPMRVPVEHLLVSGLSGGENDELMLVEDMALDLDELALTDILLSLPSKFLCRDDCRGLCLRCGKNLNGGECGCVKPADPRLRALKDLLDN